MTAAAAERWTPLTGTAHAVALAVLLDGPLPRSELARRLDLSAGSLTRLSKPLLDSGLVVETGEAHDPTTHRPTRPLDVDERAHHFVGVKLTADAAHVVVTTMRARVVGHAWAPLADTSPAVVVAVVADLVREVVEEVGLDLHADVRACGIGVGGLVDKDGIVVDAAFLGWRGVDLAGPVTDALDLPAVVGNDLLSLTRAEQWFGRARGSEHFAVLTIGEGVGYGLVVHGQVVDAPDAGVGLLGHHRLDPAGPLCVQGHAGCADVMLSTPGIVARASAALRRPVGYDELLDLAAADEPLARLIVEESARALGRLVAVVGNTTMPERVILSGGGVRLAEVGERAMWEGIDGDRSPYASRLVVDVHATGFAEWARGAAVTAIQVFVLGDGR